MSEGATKVQEGMEVQEGMGNNMIDIINEMNNEFGREDEMKLKVDKQKPKNEIQTLKAVEIQSRDSIVYDSIVDYSIDYDSMVESAKRHHKCELLIII